MKLESGQVRKKQLLLFLTNFLSTFFIRKYLDYFALVDALKNFTLLPVDFTKLGCLSSTT